MGHHEVVEQQLNWQPLGQHGAIVIDFAVELVRTFSPSFTVQEAGQHHFPELDTSRYHATEVGLC